VINHEHKFIFVHIPRTGGTSIEAQFQYDERTDRTKHWNLNDWKQQLGHDIFRNYFKFVFVRNPWDIMISKYLDETIHSRFSGSFKHFLLNYHPWKHEHGDSFFDYFLPEQMDFIGRYETREKDLKYISKKINKKIRSKLHRRQIKNKHYTEYYDDETRQIVAERYAQDIEYFGYKYGVS
tara:strand:- start:721 stop:1260 length:540 start_codon:yes stop_codon:yes gene_type:complete